MNFARAALAAVTLGLGSAAWAAPDLPETKLSSNVDVLTLSGDLRVREEYFDFKDSASSTSFTHIADRSRQRFRLRVKSEYKLLDDVTVVARLASGGGEAVSTNQTFTGGAQQKALWIDQAFMAWTPGFLGENGSLKFMGGRIVNPLWTIYTSDLVWDGDLNPEGFSQGATYLVGDSVNVFVNAMQFAVNEVSGATNDPFARDPWELSEQVGFEAPLVAGIRLMAAGARHTYLFENNLSLGTNPVQLGNVRNAAGILQDEYNVNEITAQLSGWIPVPVVDLNLPLVLQGTLINNDAARGPDWSGSVTGKYIKADGKTFLGRSNQGVQVGAMLGKASAPGSWEVAGYYKRVANDATVADFADSDFGDSGGLNRKGNIFWFNYTPNGWLTVGIKWFNNVRLLDTRYVRTAGGALTKADRLDRIQADVVVKF